jgi:magnesium transporter
MAVELGASGGSSGAQPAPEWEPATQDAIVDCAAYIDGVRIPGCSDPYIAVQAVRTAGKGFVWVGLKEPTEEDMHVIAWTFKLHELAVEDSIHAHQRAKLEQYKHTLFSVIKTVRYVEHESPSTAIELIETGEIMVWLGQDFVVTVRHGDHNALTGVRQALEAEPQRLSVGPAVVLHAIADRCVDHYLEVVGAVEDDIDELETAVFSPDNDLGIEQIYLFKREMLQLRRATAPLAAPLHRLAESPNPMVPDVVRAYFRDVEDHLAQATERVATYDELLSALVSAVLAEISTRQNEDMRRISAWAAIALVPTAVAGIYGMNFEHMPELSWTFGYPMAIGVIVLICSLLYWMLRRKGWL